MENSSAAPSAPFGTGAIPPSDAVEAQLARILASEAFANAEVLKAFLRFVVTRHLCGDDASLKGYTIGIEVFGKPPDFDPATDSTVRVRANKLRSALEEYYRITGQNDEILITLPKGRYVPEIALRSSGRPPELPHPPKSRFRRMVSVAAFVVLALLAAIFTVVNRSHIRIALPPPPGRILVRATSEGNQPRRIPLSHNPTCLAISPAGDKLFAIANDGRVLSIVHVAEESVKTIRLPREGCELAVSPDGKLYIASAIDGIMVLDIEKEQIIGTLGTGGPVRQIAIDPSGRKLFLAMGRLGLKRLSLPSGELTRITDRTCPVYVTVDHQGKRLYVAYQCSGPSGRPGHDSVEIFDVETETRLGIITGPPMVGGRINISADDQLAILDGSDSCYSAAYDHSDCPSVPSHVLHLVSATDRSIVHTFGYPVGTGPEYFVGNARFLMLGNSILVIDAATYTPLERLDIGHDEAVTAVFRVDGSRFWVGVKFPPGLLQFDLEPASCMAQEPTPSLLFTADGSMEDTSDGTVLSVHGNVAFTPGKIGQAFFLDGNSYLSVDSAGDFKIYRHNFTIAMYVRFASTAGEVALADWSAAAPANGIRMLKSSDDHFVFQSWPGGNAIASVRTVAPNVWYHLAVTKTDDLVTLYVNGKAEASGKPPMRFAEYHAPLLLGAYEPGRSSMQGWLDEVAFYNRGLTVDEVGSLYESRAAGPCKPK
jgi:DNA-binding beta-propeller fold protein YncE